jgi:RNA polymerase sigma factor (sigma-70 family)
MIGLFQPQTDLDRLIRRCRAQDPDAWADLVKRYQNLVYSIAKRYRLGDDDAADVFQTTFQALHRSLDRIEDPQTLPKWIAVTASREALKVRRVGDRTFRPEDQGFSLDDVLADEEASAEENAISAVRADAVRNGIMELADRCRDLLTLLYLEEDVPYQEVSDRLGMPIGAIGPTRARCLEKLRRILAPLGMFED